MYGLIFMACAATFFYRGGVWSGSPKKGRIWALLSVVVWLGVGMVLGGLVFQLLGQVALFIGLGIYNMQKE